MNVERSNNQRKLLLPRLPTFERCRDGFSNGDAKSCVKILSSDVRYYDLTADSGKKISRGFCPTCGSPLFALIEAMPDVIGRKSD